MTEHTPPTITMPDVHAAFNIFATQRGLEHRETIISSGPPAWFAAGYHDGQPAEALRLELTVEPDTLLAEEQSRVNILRALTDHGARIVEYLDEPHIVEGPSNATFVATTSRYLPGNDGTSYEYGQANATMHNASMDIDLGAVPLLDQLAKAQQAYAFFAKHEQAGNPVRSGEVCFDDRWLLAAGGRLAVGYRAQTAMHDLAVKKDRPLVIVQEDTHNEQYRRDHHGIVRSFDIDATKSVPEVDAGRAETQWENRLNSPQGASPQYLAGHHDRARPEVRFDADIQGHANVVSLTRFSFAMLGLGVKRLEQRQAGAEWFLNEGAYRVAVIDNPDARWHGLDAAMKRKLGL